MDWPAHPASAVFPELPEAEYRALVDDIRLHGLRQPIALWKNAAGVTYLADGRHRWRACQELDIQPDFVYWEGDDVTDRVISANVLRRHLEARDRIKWALVALEAGKRFVQEQPKRGKPCGVVSKVAKAARVSKFSVYANKDLLPKNACRTSKELADAIRQTARNMPQPKSRRGRRGGRTKEVVRLISERVGCAPATVRRHLSCSAFNKFDPQQVKPPSKPEPPSSEDTQLYKIIRLFEAIDGRDLTSVGMLRLRQCEQHIRRIDAEFRQGTTALAPAAVSPQTAHA